MPNLNKVFVMGNITRDLELKYTASGTAVTNFTVAENRHWTDKEGEKKEETTFIKVAVWAKLAENCEKYLSKGSPVMVEGRLANNQWEKDGVKHSSLEVVAMRVEFLSAPKDEIKGEGQSQAPAQGQDEPDQMPAGDSVPF